jgi:superoxide dismutase, Cu-Zn family
MMIRLPLVAAAAALALSGPAAAADSLSAPLTGAQGTVTATAAPNGVLLRVEARGLTPGWHGIHFHEKGTCGDAGFKASGAHVHDATPAVHGLLNPQATDKGDLPNIYAGADGRATAEVFSPLVRLRGGGAGLTLADVDGSAVIIHANADDHTTQPIGGAGDRVACAVLK